uniref:Cyclin-dependent kinase inhibitor 2C n=1 Tax=Ambystoma andersoni TaxID=282260 RepID=A0A873A9M9_9SALA|nr:cyclin-dependent kinase inhibitor 2C [Ambystoma andersoni]
MKLGNPEIAQILLDNGADPNLRDPTGFAVLHDAAREGFLDTIRTLVVFRAEVNIEDEEGNLPLHLAATEGHLGVVKFLLGNTDCRVSHRNKHGRTAYDLAKVHKREEIVKWMDENPDIEHGAKHG